MTSELKIEANRRNALNSTGPITLVGKSVAARNSTTHGLLATKDLLLPDEDFTEVEVLRQELEDELQPAGMIERILVERIVGAAWRLRRVYRIESGILARQVYAERAQRARRRALACESAPLRQLIQEIAPPPDTPDYQMASEEVEDAEGLRNMDDTMLGAAFLADVSGADGLGKLLRYESMLERQLFRAVHELERLRHLRAGMAVSLPVAIDVDLAGS